MDNDDEVLDILIMLEKTHFYLSSHVNEQNFTYWRDNNPMQIHEIPLRSEKVTVWCDKDLLL
jgi:hypothetical protein